MYNYNHYFQGQTTKCFCHNQLKFRSTIKILLRILHANLPGWIQGGPRGWGTFAHFAASFLLILLMSYLKAHFKIIIISAHLNFNHHESHNNNYNYVIKKFQWFSQLMGVVCRVYEWKTYIRISSVVNHANKTIIVFNKFWVN